MARRSKSAAKKTREQLLEDATFLFGTVGYANTSLDDICARSDTTKGAFFHHFKSKKDLFFEIWTDLQKQMDAASRKEGIAARSKTDPYSALMAGSRVYLDWVTRKDFQLIVLIDGPAVLGISSWYQGDYDLGIQGVRANMRYLAKLGIIAEHRIDLLAMMVQGAINSSGFALSRGEEGVTVEGVYEAIEVLVRGLN